MYFYVKDFVGRKVRIYPVYDYPVLMNPSQVCLSGEPGARCSSSTLNPFYIVECIAEWENYPLNKLSRRCAIPKLQKNNRYTSDIIHNVIYPKYKHYKTISHRN